MRNALYEKSQQLDRMAADSRQLVEQLSEIEAAFIRQQQDHEEAMQKKEMACAKWESSCLEMQKEMTKMQCHLTANSEENATLQKSIVDLKGHNEEKTEQASKLMQQVISF